MTSTSLNIILFLLCFLGCAWVSWYFITHTSTNKKTQAWCPAPLLNAQLVYAEKDFTVKLNGDYRGRITGRPDQVFKLNSGLHIPVEYKTRNHFQVHDTDIAQLSFYAFLLRKNGLATADYGYTVIENRETGERRTQKVTLNDDVWILNTLMRYEMLMKGAVPSFAFSPKCTGCAHQPRCHTNPEPHTYRLGGRK